MKKIINGKRYNTETAELIGEWTNGGSWRDFSHIYETLYRKRTGEFFLHGEGGPMTEYAQRVGLNDGWTGGECIRHRGCGKNYRIVVVKAVKEEK